MLINWNFEHFGIWIVQNVNRTIENSILNGAKTWEHFMKNWFAFWLLQCVSVCAVCTDKDNCLIIKFYQRVKKIQSILKFLSCSKSQLDHLLLSGNFMPNKWEIMNSPERKDKKKTFGWNNSFEKMAIIKCRVFSPFSTAQNQNIVLWFPKRY